MNDRDITWGTHTIPQWSSPDTLELCGRPKDEAHTKATTLWTSGKPGLMKDAGFRSRRLAKHTKHLQNQSDKAAKNARESHGK